MDAFERLTKKFQKLMSYKEDAHTNQRQVALAYELILERLPTEDEFLKHKNQPLDKLLFDVLQSPKNRKYKDIQISSPQISPSIDTETAQILLDFELAGGGGAVIGEDNQSALYCIAV